MKSVQLLNFVVDTPKNCVSRLLNSTLPQRISSTEVEAILHNVYLQILTHTHWLQSDLIGSIGDSILLIEQFSVSSLRFEKDLM